jgi:hypothetical protein
MLAKKANERKKMKKRMIKFAGLQVALLATLLVVQMGLQFAQAYKWTGFTRRDESSWVGIAGKAQAEKLSCLQEVEELKKARDEANSDILK